MADRYRGTHYQQDGQYDRADQSPTHQRAGDDPLAELARLIGQADPFSSFARTPQDQAERREHYPSDDPAPAYHDEPPQAPSWMRNRPPVPAQPMHDPFDAAMPTSHANDPFGAPQGYEQPYASQYPDPRKPSARQEPDPRYDDVLYGKPDYDPHQSAPFQVQDEHFDQYDGPYEDEQDEAPKARRGGMVTVAVVLVLAVVGTGAAFAYRNFVGSPRSGEPPVIKADAGPNKIVPAGSGGDKQITDRLGDKPAERVVSREEQPVDINGKAQPRVVFPPLTQTATPSAAASANTATRLAAGPSTGNGTLGGDEPKKIRTLSIRPDQSDANASSQTAAPAPAARPAPAPRVATPAPAAAPSNGPMALTPQSAPAPAAAPAARVASVAPSSSNGGGAYVQVSSQKTEAGAQSSFKALQAKHPGILGSRTAAVRRADLGEKGVFYRAMVGPFASGEEATQFCVNLKSAGGPCLVAR